MRDVAGADLRLAGFPPPHGPPVPMAEISHDVCRPARPVEQLGDRGELLEWRQVGWRAIAAGAGQRDGEGRALGLGAALGDAAIPLGGTPGGAIGGPVIGTESPLSFISVRCDFGGGIRPAPATVQAFLGPLRGSLPCANRFSITRCPLAVIMTCLASTTLTPLSTISVSCST
ncbi:hypothetical protein MKK84_16005 [Methylobacterium sp. E-065]|nr:hypothetical protein [Methylobacterium sp. E-065]MCJ2018928.1 hypothetical protein [Methylobacterium sp. E-065]